MRVLHAKLVLSQTQQTGDPVWQCDSVTHRNDRGRACSPHELVSCKALDIVSATVSLTLPPPPPRASGPALGCDLRGSAGVSGCAQQMPNMGWAG
eukprot:354473-Chlamydomonas_euryale.AAC.5